MRADQRQYHIIYKTTCLTTGKWYLGMHSTDDLNDGYLGSGQLLWKSLKKYGKDNHQYEILEYLPSRKALILREEELITDEVRSQPQCLNLRNGGTGNDPGFWEMTDEDKRAQASERLSAKSKKMWADRLADPIALAEHLAKINTPEIVAKRAKAIKDKGHKRTAEQLANLAAGQQNYYANVDQTVLNARGRKGAQTRLERGANKGGRPKGIPMSEEQKQRQSEQARGIKKSEEQKLKTAEGLKRYYESVDKEVIQERAARQAASISKSWIIQSEDGARQTIRNLKAFCEEHNIGRNKFRRTETTEMFVSGFRLIRLA